MGLMDRDYMRRDNDRAPSPRTSARTSSRANSRTSSRTWLLTAVFAIAVASAAIWLLRDVARPLRDSKPSEQSLAVNINTATQAELEALPGIGPALAARIMESRPHESVESLVRIQGIGPKTLDGLRALVTVDAPTEPRSSQP